MPRLKGQNKKQPLVGEGMNANLLKQFIDYSYLGNTSIAPEGYSIDAPLSDSRVKVYTKNGSNDKNVVVTHRGSVGLDDWWDNAKYMTTGKVKGTKTYNLHRERHKKAIDKYGASNIIAIGHSRAGLYLQELQKEFPIKENITYNKASGFTDIGRNNDPNQTDVRVGNDIVSLLAPTQRNPNTIVKIDNTKNPLDFNKAHQTGELDKLGTTFIGKPEVEGGAVKRKRGRPRKGTTKGTTEKKVGGMYQLGNKLANQLLGIKHPTYFGPHQPSVINVDDVFETDKVSPAYQRETLEYQEARRAEAEAVKKAQEKMLLALKSRKIGEGIQPRISGANQIRKLLGVEQRRLERIRNGTTNYKSKYITEPKTLEKISRLKKRLASAENNEGQATPEFFVPKTEKWLKIIKNDTYLNTPLKEDGKHKLMLNEVEQRIADLKAKKAKTKDEPIVLPEEPKNITLTIKKVIADEINKAQVAFFKEEPPKEEQKKLTKEERKKAKLAKKKEYDRLRYLQIKAKKLEQQAKTTTTEKQVEKLEEKVETFKEEVEDFVDDVEEEEEEEEEEDEEEEDKEIIYVVSSMGGYTDNETNLIYNTLRLNKDDIRIVGYNTFNEDGFKLFHSYENPKPIDSNIRFLLKNGKQDKTLDNWNKIQDKRQLEEKKKIGAGFNKKQLTKIILDKNEVIGDLEENAYKGKKFNNKQLTKIILDKNKVIGDLEETAYGGSYNHYSYLNNIIDSNTTPQNMIIHREHFNSVPKYIQSLVE